MQDFVFEFRLNILALKSGDEGCSGAKTASLESLKVSKPFFKFISVSFYYPPPSVENEFETQIFTSLLIDIFSEEMSQESVYIRRRIILIYLILKTNLEFLIHKLTIMANKFYYRAS